MKHKSSEREKSLVVGLGNPGAEFQDTPHNIGWQVVENYADGCGSPFKRDKFVHGKVAKTLKSGQDVFSLLPETYMNRVGLAVKSALQHWKIGINGLLVVQDDSDIPLGKIKFSFDQNSGGHKGVESIIRALGNKSFARLKIGIRPSRLPQGGKRHVKAEDFILRKMDAGSRKSITYKAKEAVRCWIAEGTTMAMNRYNRN